MEDRRPKGQTHIFNPTGWRWLIIIGAVWGVLAVIYAFLAVQAGAKQKQLTRVGRSMISTFAENAGLPLLDRDTQKLRAMLVDMGRQPGVLRVCVTDHENGIIADTAAGRLPPPAPASTREGGVETWPDLNAMIFSGAIKFSNTPIGEVRLALSRDPIARLRKSFAVIALLSLTGLVLAAALLHGRSLMALAAQWRCHDKLGKADRLVQCPLCGQGVEHGGLLRRHSHNRDKGLAFKFSGTLCGENRLSGLELEEIGSNPGLVAMKEQLIRQCNDIINKLSVKDRSSGARAGENS